jgi:hypothetical protein
MVFSLYLCDPQVSKSNEDSVKAQTNSKGMEEEGEGLISICIRDAFIPAKGCVFLSADYSQLEVRLMAHFSQDPLLMHVLSTGGDLFLNLAAGWLDKPLDSITKAERNHVRQSH